VAELERLAGLSGEPIEQRLERPLRDYWLDRAALHTEDSYAGIPLSKLPEDLRVYEHLLWAQRPDAVIEIGTYYGASTLWFRDRLRLLASYGPGGPGKVIAIELDAAKARRQLERADPAWQADITLIESDVAEPGLPERVAELLGPADRCLVIEDSGHTYETTMAALEGFSRFVAPGGFMVVEDGYVDIEEMRLEEHWPQGVLPAVADWLQTAAGGSFRVRRDLELYGITGHPGGMLERTA
jgi:cephalosporin hydroxylase